MTVRSLAGDLLGRMRAALGDSEGRLGKSRWTGSDPWGITDADQRVTGPDLGKTTAKAQVTALVLGPESK
ncbi:MAG: hypothetical protein AMXMBFR46_18510 [Acidimicrobiia bacterium]